MSVTTDLLGDPALGMVREVRPSQIRMAEAVEAVIADGGVCMVEGPVGCGKTFAYLTPALLATGRRVVVATAKKGLQDQIKTKDLPFLVDQMEQHLGKDFQARLVSPSTGAPMLPGTIIKGKGNYACRALILQNAPADEILSWLDKSPSGEWGEYPGRVPQWRSAATAENCVGRSCDHYATCQYTQAKEAAKLSKIVVVNHHLLGSDMYFGHGKLVGGPYDILVIDEAHKLADGIRAAFTLRVTQTSAIELADELKDLSWTFPAANALVKPWEMLFENLPRTVLDEKGYKVDTRFQHLRDTPVFEGGDKDALDGLESLQLELDKTLSLYGVTEEGGFEQAELPDDVRTELMQLSLTRRKVAQLFRGISTMQGRVKPLEGEDPAAAELRAQRIIGNTAIIGSTERKGVVLQAMPITLGGLAKNYFTGVRSVILTSATLAVNKGFDHMNDVVGVRPSQSMILPPTFDYGAQGFAFVPRDLPSIPKGDEAAPAVAAKRLDYCSRLVKLSRGGTFVLATSYDDLNDHAFHLAKSTPHRVFAQLNEKIRQRWYQTGYTQEPDANPWFGEPPAILARFLTTPNGVLVGAKSFWEGVDVVGKQLRLVILTKLPFPNISDPMIKARRRPIISWMLEQGQTRKEAEQYAWSQVDLVDMLIDLRQGVGRLIRSKSDRGVIVILDSRVWTKPYGTIVKQSLEFGVTDQFAKCEKWLPLFA